MNSFVVLFALFGLAAANPQFLAGLSASQYRYQDEFGQHAFGHVGGPNSREEVRSADGSTRGSYSYVDGNGLVQSAVYSADAANGFRVAATNLPVGPAVPAAPTVAHVATPIVTPAVAPVASVVAARLAYPSAFYGASVVHALKKRDLVAVSHPLTSYPGSTAPLVHSAPVVSHVAAPVAYATPVAYSAPIAHVATPLAHSYVAPAYTHYLKKRSAFLSAPLALPYHAIHAGALAVPADEPVVAHAKAAQLIQQNTEAIRNNYGGVPLALPADTPEVAQGKIAHAIAHANQAAVTSPLVASPLVTPFAARFGYPYLY